MAQALVCSLFSSGDLMQCQSIFLGQAISSGALFAYPVFTRQAAIATGAQRL
jgi:hypothetical protein